MKIHIRVQDRVLYNTYHTTDYSLTIGEPLHRIPSIGDVQWLSIDSSIGISFEGWMEQTFGDTVPYKKLIRDSAGNGLTLIHFGDKCVQVPHSQVFYNDHAKLVFGALCEFNEAYLKRK